MRDLFTLEKYDVVDRIAPKTLKGRIIYCSVMELGRLRTFLGIAPIQLMPTSKTVILEFRNELAAELGHELTWHDVVDCESEIRSLFIGLMIETVLPQSLVNTDDESLIEPIDVSFSDVWQDEAAETATGPVGIRGRDIVGGVADSKGFVDVDTPEPRAVLAEFTRKPGRSGLIFLCLH